MTRQFPMKEKNYRRELANLIKRYDEAWETKKGKRVFDDDWAFFMQHCTEDQARRANDLLALHVENSIEDLQ